MAVRCYVLLCLAIAGVKASGGWGYGEGEHGPAHWLDECNKNSSKKQSPINIDASKAEYSEDLDDFKFTGYGKVDAEMKNNGHSVQATLTDQDGVKMSGGDLGATYKLAQFHFHWGSKNSQGSEHSLDEEFYPMETHYVHFNEKYDNLSYAVDKEDGLAVLAFFFKVADKDNENYKDVIEAIDGVKTSKDAEEELKDLDLTKLMGDTDGVYFRYSGSLTTPGCDESVKWTVFEEPIEISEAQLKVIREVTNGEDDGHKTENNFRPVQKLHDRKIYTNMASALTVCTSVLLASLAAVFLM